MNISPRNRSAQSKKEEEKDFGLEEILSIIHSFIHSNSNVLEEKEERDRVRREEERQHTMITPDIDDNLKPLKVNKREPGHNSRSILQLRGPKTRMW